MNEHVPTLARAESPAFGLNDSIYNRLLRERIIWLGSEVRDDNANAICAQMLLLAAEELAQQAAVLADVEPEAQPSTDAASDISVLTEDAKA